MAVFSIDKYIVHLTYLRSLQEEFWIDYNTYQEMTLYWALNFVFLVLLKPRIVSKQAYVI
jgi:hypothetical protein